MDGSLVLVGTSLCMSGYQQPGFFGVEVAPCREPNSLGQQWFYDKYGQLRPYAALLCVDVVPGSPAKGGVVQLLPCFNAFADAGTFEASPRPSLLLDANLSVFVASVSELLPSLDPSLNVNLNDVTNMSFSAPLCLDAAGFVPGVPALLRECRTRAYAVDPNQLWGNPLFNVLRVAFGNGEAADTRDVCLGLPLQQSPGKVSTPGRTAARVGSPVLVQNCIGTPNQQWWLDARGRLRSFAAVGASVGVEVGPEGQLLLQLAGVRRRQHCAGKCATFFSSCSNSIICNYVFYQLGRGVITAGAGKGTSHERRRQLGWNAR
jgi:hypothetical protein